MFLNRRMFTALAVCLCLSASTAFAGGNGGTKKDSTIKVTNNSTTATQVGVAVDPSAALLAATTVQEFQDRGKSIGSGGTATFSVKSGAHRVVLVDLTTGDPLADQNGVYVAKGKTLKGTFIGPPGGLTFTSN